MEKDKFDRYLIINYFFFLNKNNLIYDLLIINLFLHILYDNLILDFININVKCSK